MLQRDRAVTTLFATYVALLVAETWSKPITDFLAGDRTIFHVYVAGKLSPFSIMAALFVGLIILLAQKSGLKSGRVSSLSSFEVAFFSLCSTVLLIAALLQFMSAGQLSQILAQSKIAAAILQYKNLVLLLAPLAVIIFGARRGE